MTEKKIKIWLPSLKQRRWLRANSYTFLIVILIYSIVPSASAMSVSDAFGYAYDMITGATLPLSAITTIIIAIIPLFMILMVAGFLVALFGDIGDLVNKKLK